MKILLLLLLIGITVQAQEVSGFTALEWDPVAHTLTGYAETNLDDYASEFYSAAVNTYLYNSHGTLLNSVQSVRNLQYPIETADAVLGYSTTVSDTYTQKSTHFAIIVYPLDCAGSNCQQPQYQDQYYYTGFQSLYSSIDFQDGVDLFGPGPNYRAPIRTPYIPPTH